ncbi:MAG TPA: YciI family protein [Polyangiaceae bacterium]|jgi:hypothetical protein
MSEYLFLYRGGERAQSPEAMQQQMQKWMTWMKELKETGNLKDPGQPLDRPGKVVRSKKAVTDGPFAEKDIVSGFTIIEAKDLDHATRLTEGCPIFETGGAIEVRPIMKMSM